MGSANNADTDSAGQDTGPQAHGLGAALIPEPFDVDTRLQTVQQVRETDRAMPR